MTKLISTLKKISGYLFVICSCLIISSCALLTGKVDNIKGAGLNPNSSSSRVAAEILKIDIDHLVAKIIEIHPEPFAMISEREFRHQAETIKHSIRYPLSRSEFYMRIAPLVAQLQDIHSTVQLPKFLQEYSLARPNSSDLNSPLPEHRNTLFPVAVLYEKKALYVAADLTMHPQIPTGASIESINGAPIAFLLQVMRGLTARETDTGQRRQVQVEFPWLLAAMGYASEFYTIRYQWQNQSFERRVKGINPPPKNQPVLDDTDVSSELAADDGEHRLLEPKDKEQALKLPHSFYGYSQLTSKTALLWFNDFHEDPSVFRQFIGQKFQKLKRDKVDNLIIDVRYNEGGLSQNIKVLLSYLANKPIYWSQQGEIKLSKPLKRLHQLKTKKRRKNKYHWGLQWLPLEWTDALQYEVSWGDVGNNIKVDFDPITPSEDYIPKKTVVLINGFCYSACSSFVAAVNRNELATTIGETAGSFARVQYAYPLTIILPHSQLRVTLPTMKLFFDKQYHDRKVIMGLKDSLIQPQIAIQRNKMQIIQRRDPLLTNALLLME